MTGRIEVLATAQKPGRIITSNGPNRFHYSYQLLPSRTRLRVGRMVTFDLERDNSDAAVRVCPMEQEDSFLAGLGGHAEVRYQGFEQKNDVRSFKFRAGRTGEEDQEVVVTADLALFRKHGITIQEGPALCLRFVEAELQQRSLSESGAWRRTLTEKELIAHMAHRNSLLKSKT
ncbi:MAG: hypothetical protein EHM23_21065 [Acidobacteria bacterium]|nr:MAG: hypothetical protein EHM23_21065 [Acidobacteriota bacterium]